MLGHRIKFLGLVGPVLILCVLFQISFFNSSKPSVLTTHRPQTKIRQSLATPRPKNKEIPIQTTPPIQTTSDTHGPLIHMKQTGPMLRAHVLSTEQQKKIYSKDRNMFNNKADFLAVRRLAKDSDMCVLNHTILIGGVNEGQSTYDILQICPNVEIRGFEIQPDVFFRVRKRFKGHSNVKVYNVGWGEKSLSGMSIGGPGEQAGLLQASALANSRFSNWRLHNQTASTVVIPEWCRRHGITSVGYVLIDVEGYEPKVLRGMHLEDGANQKLFPHIQYELGGTWAARDPRHGGLNEWSQYDTAVHMEKCGYLIFLIGERGWMPVNSEFFREGGHMLEEEGNGKFVQGNLLCLHSQYADKSMFKVVVKSPIEG